MLELYHAASSVCSQKARIALAEKGLEWQSHLIDLGKGEQFAPAYLRLNPEAVVPTLVHDGMVIRESSLLCEYVDRLSATNPLMPREIGAEFTTRLWLLRCISIHEAINSVSFATLMRDRERAARTPQETEAALARIPNPQVRAKRRDVYLNGPDSVFVQGALHVLRRQFEDMAEALARSAWLAGAEYGLADTALLAYVDRLDRLGMEGLWQKKYAAVGTWLAASKQRPSYATAISAYISPEDAAATRKIGAAYWPQIEALWE
ncbi:glutathione S-transferase family protein [Phaeovulum sp.]|uniref:glutathione S-transferase family protein n=1 Tax=Phaeovulum sp. TaxID=2934796 RepID=UPI00356681AF